MEKDIKNNEVKVETKVEQKVAEEKTTDIKSMQSVMKDLQSIIDKKSQTTIEVEEEKVKDQTVETSEVEDIKQNKKIAWLAYVLFFIPLLINKKSAFVRLHANEGLDVFVIDVVASVSMILSKVIAFSATSAIIGHLLFLLGLGLFALTTVTKIFQIVQVVRGKKNQTPWLWKTKFIK